MKTLQNMNPIPAFLWLILAAGIAMFCFDPLIILISLFGSVSYFMIRNSRLRLRGHLLYWILPFLSMLLNPLFSHNGRTVLFVMNSNPVTLEAVIYGAAFGAMLVSTLYWFRSFQQIMTSDKLLYVFGSVFPKMTLILSIALRYIPLFRKQTVQVRNAQKALGLFRDENMIDRLRGETRVFSVMVTWALENGVITADSMSARGCGIGRRTRFALFRFRRQDALLTLLCLLFAGAAIAPIALGSLSYSYYPAFVFPRPGGLSLLTYIFYFLLAMFPSILETEENLRWKFLRSAI